MCHPVSIMADLIYKFDDVGATALLIGLQDLKKTTEFDRFQCFLGRTPKRWVKEILRFSPHVIRHQLANNGLEHGEQHDDGKIIQKFEARFTLANNLGLIDRLESVIEIQL